MIFSVKSLRVNSFQVQFTREQNCSRSRPNSRWATNVTRKTEYQRICRRVREVYICVLCELGLSNSFFHSVFKPRRERERLLLVMALLSWSLSSSMEKEENPNAQL